MRSDQFKYRCRKKRERKMRKSNYWTALSHHSKSFQTVSFASSYRDVTISICHKYEKVSQRSSIAPDLNRDLKG